MGFIADYSAIILYITGALTVLPIMGLFAPGRMMEQTFGSYTQSWSSDLMARHWGLLVGGTGLMMIYAGAFPEVRLPILLFAMAEKALLVVLALKSWEQAKETGVKGAVVLDSIMVILLALILLSS